MKTLKIFSFIPLFMAFTIFSFAQNTKAEAIGSFTQKTKTETIPVSGNCGMCKSAIEKAARKAGATSASWDMDSKNLTIKYSTSTTNAAKVQQSIAAVGYDTRDFKATDESYNKLHACCQYDRIADVKTASCCSEKCEMKDGKCTGMEVCKEKGCCSAAAGNHDGMDCCKDGKCTKPGPDGKDCCKKS